MQYINYLNTYRPSTIARRVPAPGPFYSAGTSSNTSRFLGSYGVFQSTEVSYAGIRCATTRCTPAVVLVPMKRWSLFRRLNAVSKAMVRRSRCARRGEGIAMHSVARNSSPPTSTALLRREIATNGRYQCL